MADVNNNDAIVPPPVLGKHPRTEEPAALEAKGAALVAMVCPICRLLLRGPHVAALCGHVCCRQCAHELMDKSADVLNTGVAAGSFTTFPSSGYAVCPKCRISCVHRRLFLGLETLCPDYEDDFSKTGSPLRCAFAAVLKTRARYPGFKADYTESDHGINITEYMANQLIELTTTHYVDATLPSTTPPVPPPSFLEHISTATALKTVTFLVVKRGGPIALMSNSRGTRTQYLRLYYPSVDISIVIVIDDHSADEGIAVWSRGELKIPAKPAVAAAPHRVQVTYSATGDMMSIDDAPSPST